MKAKFGGNRHFGSGDLIFLVVGGQGLKMAHGNGNTCISEER